MIPTPWGKGFYSMLSCLAICPEEAAGLGTPRPPMRFYGLGEEAKLINVTSKFDHTEQLLSHSQKIVENLPELDGALLKAKSPSCAIDDCKIFDDQGNLLLNHARAGVFTQSLLKAYPQLPLIDEKRILDEDLKTHFLFRLLQNRNLRTVQSPEMLNQFHQSQKICLACYKKSETQEVESNLRNKNLEGYKVAFRKLLTPEITKAAWIERLNRALDIKGQKSLRDLNNAYQERQGLRGTMEWADFIPSDFERIKFSA